MKKQIRFGTFETNSSSTHSLQLSKTENVKDIVYQKLIEKYEESLDDNPFCGNGNDKSELIDENALILRGFSEEYGDEQTFMSHVITDPIFKIQYLFGLIYERLRDTLFYEKSDTFGYGLIPEISEHGENAFIEKQPIYIKFVECILNYCKTHQAYSNITEVRLSPGGMKEGIYLSEEYDKIYEKMFESNEELVNTFNKVMDNDTSIVTFDIPYSMYGSPVFNLY